MVRKERIYIGFVVKDFFGIMIDEEKVVFFIEVLKLKEVLEKFVVIGGGYIGLEMGFDWGSSLGFYVIVVEFGVVIVLLMVV